MDQEVITKTAHQYGGKTRVVGERYLMAPRFFLALKLLGWVDTAPSKSKGAGSEERVTEPVAPSSEDSAPPKAKAKRSGRRGRAQ